MSFFGESSKVQAGGERGGCLLVGERFEDSVERGALETQPRGPHGINCASLADSPQSQAFIYPGPLGRAPT
jgi:hypothetical protein